MCDHSRMHAKNLYLVFCVAGLVVPNIAFVPWLWEHGLDLSRFFAELFGNRISAAFGLDVILSVVVLLAFVLVERIRLRLALWWLPVVAALLVGVSLGLPLLLYLREVALECTSKSSHSALA